MKTQFLIYAVLGAAVAAEAEPIAIPNPGFEDDLTGWVVPSQYQSSITVTSSTPYSGIKAVQIDVPADPEQPYVYAQSTQIQGSATYQWKAYARRVAGGAGGSAGVKIEFYNARGENTTGVWSRQPLDDSGNWTPLTVTVQADGDSVRASLLLGAFGQGSIAFDETAFSKTEDAPDLRILDPVRLAVRSGRWSPVKFTLGFREAPAATPPFSVELFAGTGNWKAAGKGEALDSTTYMLPTRIPSLPAGLYTADAVAGTLRSVTPIEVFVTPSARRPPRLTTSGALIWHSKYFLPIGLYHVNHTDAEYATLAANGFNAIQGPFSDDPDHLRTLLDLAQTNGLAVEVPLHAGNLVAANLDTSLAKIHKLGTHPAVLSWKIFDEPDADKSAGMRDEVLRAYLALKKIRPRQPLELTLSQDAPLGFWTKACDLVQIDRYPVPDRRLTDVLDFCTAASKAKEPWQNLTFVVQCGWTPDLKTQPTFDQARSMVYLALIGGAKGIFWYSRQDPEWDLTTTPLWPRLKEINREIASLATPILRGRNVLGMKCNTTTVPFLTKRYGRAVYLLATNPGNTAQEVILTFPASVRPRAARLLGGSQSVTLQNGTARVPLAPVGSATVVLDL